MSDKKKNPPVVGPPPPPHVMTPPAPHNATPPHLRPPPPHGGPSVPPHLRDGAGAGNVVENAVESLTATLGVRYWRRKQGPSTPYPETELPEVMTRPNIGVCFSGGGFRSAAASLGQMRAIVAMGLDARLRYTASNSGGSWFAVPYTFLPASQSETNLFGEYLPLESIKSYAQLRTSCEKSRWLQNIADSKTLRNYHALVAVDLAKHLGAFLATPPEITVTLMTTLPPLPEYVPEPEVGVPTSGQPSEFLGRAIGREVLKPLGLFDSGITGTHRFFTWSDLTRKAALASNPRLEAADFHIVERKRPFNITVGVLGLRSALVQALLAPSKALEGMRLFEMTPFYSGASETAPGIGGGFVESFGQDTELVDTLPTSDNGIAKTHVGRSFHRFTLADVIGISGSALGITGHLTQGRLTPTIRHWPVIGPAANPTPTLDAIDGGYLDSQAIMPLLARRVERIVAFVNGDSPLDNGLKASIRHLFGDASNPSNDSWICQKANQVFDNTQGQLAKLAAGLKENRKNYAVAFFRSKYRVIGNPNYGITPYDVEILWYYLDRSTTWSDKIQHLEGQCSTTQGADSLKDFPHYSTFRVCPTAEELTLLSNYTHWCVEKTRSVLEDFLR